MSLLTICQDAASRIGITAPSVVATSTDLQVKQLYALANEEGDKLSTGESIGISHDWRELLVEEEFDTIAAEDQGNINTIAPGFRFIVAGSMFNRSLRRAVPGPLPPDKWQLLKAANVVGPYPQWRILGQMMKFLPVPPAGQQIYFEYQTAYWASSATGTLKARFTADDDVSLLPERLITAGLVWRWKKAKGLEYAEDFRDYQTSVHMAMQRNATSPVLNMGDPEYRSGVILVPQSPGIVAVP